MGEQLVDDRFLLYHESHLEHFFPRLLRIACRSQQLSTNPCWNHWVYPFYFSLNLYPFIPWYSAEKHGETWRNRNMEKLYLADLKVALCPHRLRTRLRSRRGSWGRYLAAHWSAFARAFWTNKNANMTYHENIWNCQTARTGTGTARGARLVEASRVLNDTQWSQFRLVLGYSVLQKRIAQWTDEYWLLCSKIFHSSVQTALATSCVIGMSSGGSVPV